MISNKVLITQLCPTLCDPMDCSQSGFSVHRILQARILLWDDIPFSRVSSWPRDQTQVSPIAGSFFTVWVTREAQFYMSNLKRLLFNYCWVTGQNTGDAVMKILS